jgi:hypothetical protein
MLIAGGRSGEIRSIGGGMKGVRSGEIRHMEMA